MTKNVWQADFDKITAALESGGHVVHAEGFSYLSASAPKALQSAYSGIANIGYAKGWV